MVHACLWAVRGGYACSIRKEVMVLAWPKKAATLADVNSTLQEYISKYISLNLILVLDLHQIHHQSYLLQNSINL